MFGVSPATF